MIRTPQRVPRWFTVGVIALWSFGVFVPSTVFAQHGAGMHGPGSAQQQQAPAYETKSEATFTGTVADVNTGGPGRLTQLLLKTVTGTVLIHLGPTLFLEAKSVEIREGDTLEVTGSRVTLGDAPVVLAREIRRGDNVWTLRDATGQPLWNSVQTEARGFWTKKKILLTAVAVKVALLATVLRN